MKVRVKVFKFANGKPDQSPCNEFDIVIDASYDQYETNDDFKNELCHLAAQRLDTDRLSKSSDWKSKQEKGCEVVVDYFDEGGVATDVVVIRNGELTSSRERLRKHEGKFLLQVSWE